MLTKKIMQQYIFFLALFFCQPILPPSTKTVRAFLTQHRKPEPNSEVLSWNFAGTLPGSIGIGAPTALSGRSTNLTTCSTWTNSPARFNYANNASCSKTAMIADPGTPKNLHD